MLALLNFIGTTQQTTPLAGFEAEWWKQIPVIAAFIWFVIQLSRHQAEQLRAAQAERIAMREKFESERTERDQMWQKWLEAQSQRNTELHSAQLASQNTALQQMMQVTWEKVDGLKKAVETWDENTCRMTESFEEVLRQLQSVSKAVSETADVTPSPKPRRRTTKPKGGDVQ